MGLRLVAGIVLTGAGLPACTTDQGSPPAAESTVPSPESPTSDSSPVDEAPAFDLTSLDPAKDQWQDAHFEFLELYNEAPADPSGLAAYVRRTERQLRVVDRSFRRFEAIAQDALDVGSAPPGLREFLSVMDQWLDNQHEQNEVFHRCGLDPQCIFVDNVDVFEEGQRLSTESTRLQQTDPALAAFLSG